MAVKIYKPTTPGQRNKSGYAFEEITKSKPEAWPRKQNAVETPSVASPFATAAARADRSVC